MGAGWAMNLAEAERASRERPALPARSPTVWFPLHHDVGLKEATCLGAVVSSLALVRVCRAGARVEPRPWLEIIMSAAIIAPPVLCDCRRRHSPGETNPIPSWSTATVFHFVRTPSAI